MSKCKRREVAPDEQHVLEQGYVLLLTSAKDVAQCDQLIRQHHYLRGVTLVGEHARYAFVYRGRWLALATWSSAAFHLKARDQFIGWSGEQCARRRCLLANNSRLLVMPGDHSPNLISRFMKLMMGSVPESWNLSGKRPGATMTGRAKR